MSEDYYTSNIRKIVRQEIRGLKSALYAINQKIKILDGKEVPTGDWTRQDDRLFWAGINDLIASKARALNVSVEYIETNLIKTLKYFK